MSAVTASSLGFRGDRPLLLALARHHGPGLHASELAGRCGYDNGYQAAWRLRSLVAHEFATAGGGPPLRWRATDRLRAALATEAAREVAAASARGPALPAPPAVDAAHRFEELTFKQARAVLESYAGQRWVGAVTATPGPVAGAALYLCDRAIAVYRDFDGPPINDESVTVEFAGATMLVLSRRLFARARYDRALQELTVVETTGMQCQFELGASDDE